jgi:hypothetical protein
LLAPAAGHDGVQALHDRLRAEVRGALRARIALAVERTLLIALKPIGPGANGRRNRAAASAWVRAGGLMVVVGEGMLSPSDSGG